MSLAAWLWLLACGGPGGPDATVREAIVGVQVDTRTLGEGKALQLEVQVAAPTGASWTIDVPTPAGVTLAEPTERVERAGNVTVTTRRYGVTATAPSFVFEGVCAQPEGSPPSCANPLYVDLGAPPDRSAMIDIVEPPRLWPLPPWWAIAGLAAAGVGVTLAIRWWRRRPIAVVLPPPPEPPHLAAIRRWEAVRADASLTDHDKALALSEIFRAYAEAVLAFPARSWTTSQILERLEGLELLARENLPRARKLLRATDRVKYAEARPGVDFFEELDADLRAFIDSTRPHTWGDR